MFDYLDNMLTEQTYAPPPEPVLPPTQATAQAQQTPAAPSILDLLSRTTAPAPALPQADTSMLNPLTLLHFAAGVSQPRAQGQSTVGKILQSVAGAAAYNMQEKQRMEDRVVEQEMQRRKVAAADAQLEQSKLGAIQTRQGIMQAEQRNPLELDKLKAAIEGAKTENELNGLKVRIATIKAEYARAEEEAALAERSAKTDSEKADAIMKRAHANYFQRQADELVNLAQIRASNLNRPAFSLKEGLPGDPTKLLDIRSGNIYRPPMSPADALDYAKRQVEARKAMGEFKDSTAEKLGLQQEYQSAIKGNMPVMGATTGATAETAPEKPAPQAPQGSGMTDAYKNAMVKSGSSRNTTVVYQEPSDGKITVFIGGVPQATYPNLAGYQADWTNGPNGPVRKTAAVQPQAASTNQGQAPAAGGAPDPMMERYLIEQNQIAAGRRRVLSPDVMAWMAANKKASGDIGPLTTLPPRGE